jgi:hypothetical protein
VRRTAFRGGRRCLFLIFIRRFDSDEELVPFLVFARFGGPASRKGPAQQLEIRDEILLCPSPVRQFLAARSSHLVRKELDQTFVNPVIVRFHDTLAVFVVKPEQAFLLNSGPDEWIDVRVDFRCPWILLLYAYLPLSTFMLYSETEPGCVVPMSGRSADAGRSRTC